MRIVHVIFSFTMGGSETMLVDIANGQSSLGHDVTVLIVNNVVNGQLLGRISPEVRIVRLNRTPGSSKLNLVWRLNRAIRRLKPDAVHLHNNNLNRVLLGGSRRRVCTVHAIDLPVDDIGGIRVVAISQTVKDDIQKRMPGKEIEQIENGIHIADVKRRKAGGFGEMFRMVQVGRLVPELKGQDLTIRAMGQLAAEGIANIELHLIGEGQGEQQLRDLARECGVADRVIFEGGMSRTEVYDTLQNYDAMIHPSRLEGFGLVIAEGMAAGLPLIVSEKDGPWEVADCGRLCKSVPKDDPKALASAIREMMEHYDEALALAQKGLEYVRRFDIMETCRRYIDLYRSL